MGSSLPAVSRRLAGMEARLGVSLIDRGTRRFALTEEGSLFYERGMTILNELHALETQVSARTSEPFGHLRVGAPNQIGRRRFAPLMAEFARRFPHVTVELVLTDNRVDVVGDELDIGLHIDEPHDTSIVIRKLLSSRRVPCASPGYLAAHGRPVVPADLRHHNCLCLVRGRHVFNTWRFAIDGAPQEVYVRGSLTSTSAEVIYGWALAGQGIAFKAAWDIGDDLAAGRLEDLLPDCVADEVNIYLTYFTRLHLARRSRVFIDFMTDALQSRSARA